MEDKEDYWETSEYGTVPKCEDFETDDGGEKTSGSSPGRHEEVPRTPEGDPQTTLPHHGLGSDQVSATGTSSQNSSSEDTVLVAVSSMCESTDVSDHASQSIELAFSSGTVPEGMTARQWKIELRKRRRAIRKEEAMLRRKERDKQKKEIRRLEKMKRPKTEEVAPRAKRKKMSDDGASTLTVAIDLSYEDLMSEKDMKKIMHQCQRCYSSNRRAESPLQLYFTSFSPQTMAVWDKQFTAYRNWDVHRKQEGFIELFGKERSVFLTSDSPNILKDIELDKVYIIGGLVDHNHHKGHCYKKALELGIKHAQLPISQYIKLNCREVLAVNHVFEILLEFSSGHDWEKAFYAVIPPRKVASKPSEVIEETPVPQLETSCRVEQSHAVSECSDLIADSNSEIGSSSPHDT